MVASLADVVRKPPHGANVGVEARIGAHRERIGTGERPPTSSALGHVPFLGFRPAGRLMFGAKHASLVFVETKFPKPGAEP